MLNELQFLGFTKNEAMAYDLLVKNGPCKAGKIIAKANIHRNLVYRALESLVENGYITKVTKKGVWHFQITDPQVLFSNMKRKEEVFASVIKEISRYQVNTTQQMVVYEGVDSYRKYWIESLSRVPENTIDYVAGGELGQWEELMGENLLEEYFKLAKKKKLHWKTIYFKNRGHEIKLLKKYPVPYEGRVIYSKSQPDLMGSNFNVIHDTVIFHSIIGTPRIIEIRDKAMVDLFQTYFNVLWEKAEQIKS